MFSRCFPPVPPKCKTARFRSDDFPGGGHGDHGAVGTRDEGGTSAPVFYPRLETHGKRMGLYMKTMGICINNIYI